MFAACVAVSSLHLVRAGCCRMKITYKAAAVLFATTFVFKATQQLRGIERAWSTFFRGGRLCAYFGWITRPERQRDILERVCVLGQLVDRVEDVDAVVHAHLAGGKLCMTSNDYI